VENLRVLNSLGAVVYEKKQAILPGQQFHVKANLPAGIYYLELKNRAGQRVVKKLAVD
jgi:hypothetical protein